MKHLMYLLLTGLSIFIGFQGCQSPVGNERNEKQNATQIKISGKVFNAVDDKVALAVNPDDGQSKTYKLNENGEFSGTFPLSKARYLKFTHGEQYTNSYAQPGDSIHLTLDYDQFDESLEYSGTRAHINKYLASKILLGDTVSLMSSGMQMRALYSKSPEAFSHTVDSVYNIYKDHFEDYFKDKEAPERFLKYEKTNLKCEFHPAKYRYPRLKTRLNAGEKPQIPDGFFAFQEDIDLDNAELMNVPNYKSFLSSFLGNKRSEVLKQDSALMDSNRHLVYKKTVTFYIPNDTLQARLISGYIKRQISRNDISELKPLLSYYEQLPYEDEQKAAVESKLEKKRALARGKEAPGFAYPSYEGDTVSLADLEGSYVYIDAWATWCGPCIREIPHLKELHEEFKDQNIEFVSISLDRASDSSKWRSMVKEKELVGHQLFANGDAFDAKLAKDYMITGIPRFILIDPEGKIIDANAKRPSRGIDERLEKLLTKGKSA